MKISTIAALSISAISMPIYECFIRLFHKETRSAVSFKFISDDSYRQIAISRDILTEIDKIKLVRPLVDDDSVRGDIDVVIDNLKKIVDRLIININFVMKESCELVDKKYFLDN